MPERQKTRFMIAAWMGQCTRYFSKIAKFRWFFGVVGGPSGYSVPALEKTAARLLLAWQVAGTMARLRRSELGFVQQHCAPAGVIAAIVAGILVVLVAAQGGMGGGGSQEGLVVQNW